MTERKAIGKKTRFEVFKRDAFTCQYCGATPPKAILHIDHIVALAAGGENHVDNYITSCEPCNLGKGSRDLKVAAPSLKDKAALVAEREAQLLGYQEILQASRDRLEEEQWRVADVIDPGSPERGMKLDWLSSIRRFITARGLHDVLDAAEIASDRYPCRGRKTFLYFCGICWNRIREDEANV